jgi:hypothetical protein
MPNFMGLRLNLASPFCRAQNSRAAIVHPIFYFSSQLFQAQNQAIQVNLLGYSPSVEGRPLNHALSGTIDQPNHGLARWARNLSRFLKPEPANIAQRIINFVLSID